MSEYPRLAWGTELDVTISKLDRDAVGICTWEGATVSVPNSLPGDRCIATVRRQHRRQITALPTRWIESSPLREASLCSHFPVCGGCRFADVAYENQLPIKQDLFSQIVTPLHLNALIRQVIASPSHRFHRNKMEFTVFRDTENRLRLGLKQRGRFDQSVATSNCQIFDERWGIVSQWLETELESSGIEVYRNDIHTGSLRYVVVRKSELENTWLLNFVVARDETSRLAPMAVALQQQFPWISGVIMGLQSTQSDTAFTLHWQVLSGHASFMEQIGTKQFRVSPYSFFQTNTAQAQVLYQTALDLAAPKSTDRMLDLYCGAATIGIFFSDHVASVVGVEENPSAIYDAHFNINHNQVQNMSVRLGKVKNILKFEKLEADLIVVDPPRSGLEPKALLRAAAVGSPKIVYVSCKPSTFVPDLLALETHGYRTMVIQPVDMFPHSPHLEAVAVLIKD